MSPCASSVPAGFDVDHIGLRFDLDPDCTRVVSRLHLTRSADFSDAIGLAGPVASLESAQVVAGTGRIDCSQPDRVVIRSGADELEVEFVAAIHPYAVKPRTGLFGAGDILCTQCEPYGYRRFAFGPDEPRSRSAFTVEISADADRFPVLVSNGRVVTEGIRHSRATAVWDDPKPKPSYLFALAAGRFDRMTRTCQAGDGSIIDLAVLTPPNRASAAEFAMEVLVDAIRFDERYLGLGCGLDAYSMIAIDGYPQTGAEAQGVGLFQPQSILVDPSSSVDSGLEAVERSVAHEFFHTWTGVRVGIADWRDLSLKEGLTVFREQRFIEDRHGSGLPRLEYVQRVARALNDPGLAISDGSTVSYGSGVYYYGAALVEALRDLSGEAEFTAGLRAFLMAHDGASASWEDLFARTGTSARRLGPGLAALARRAPPKVKVGFEASPGRLTIRVARTNDGGSRETEELPAAPVNIALLLVDEKQRSMTERLLPLWLSAAEQERRETIEIPGLVAWSLGRDPPLPARSSAADAAEMAHRFAIHSPSPISRALHLQPFVTGVLANRLRAPSSARREPAPGAEVIHMLRRAFAEADRDPGLTAYAIRLPPIMDIAALAAPCFPDDAARVRDEFGRAIVPELEEELWASFDRTSRDEPTGLDPYSRGRRSLLKACMSLLSLSDDASVSAALLGVLRHARTTTTLLAALEACLRQNPQLTHHLVREVLDRDVTDEFRERLSIVLARCSPIEIVSDLASGAFPGLPRPARPRLFWNAFATGNPLVFHGERGVGYRLLARTIAEVDLDDPVGSSRLCRHFESACSLPWSYRTMALSEVRELLESNDLSQSAGTVAEAAIEKLAPHHSPKRR